MGELLIALNLLFQALGLARQAPSGPQAPPVVCYTEDGHQLPPEQCPTAEAK